MEAFEQARAQSKIDRTELVNFIYGGKERYEKYAKTIEILSSDNVFKDPSVFELSRHDLAGKVIEKTVKHGYPKFSGDARGIPDEVFFTDNIFPMGSVGAIMVSTVIDIMGTDEQKQEWLAGMRNNTIITTYAQTELAHGTDV